MSESLNNKRTSSTSKNKSILFVTVYFLVFFLLLVSFVDSKSAGCSSKRLVLYQVTFKTFWTKEEFPKDYPEFRPPAQWSKLVGRSHNSEFTLFRIGSFASLGLKNFILLQNSDILDEFSQGTAGVYDAFTSQTISQGEGQAETQFFVDNNHSMVSIVSRMIPSPDWFVGVDSIQLCDPKSHEWIQTRTFEVVPIDAGVDNGYTFTSPKWPSIPQEAIFEITSQYPNHPANSFYANNKSKQNRRIASFTFEKMKEYSVRGNHFIEEKETDEIEINAEDFTVEKEVRPQKKKRSRKLKGNRVDCVVSEWNDWSDCTSKTCDIAEQYRTRSVIKPAKSNGRKCPPLAEKRLCKPVKDCRPDHFSW